MKTDTDSIKGWLSNQEKDRAWLAAEIGVSKRTLDNWFSDGFPLYAEKAIVRIAKEIESDAVRPDESAISLSVRQWQELSRRSKESGFEDEMDFVNALLRESLKLPPPKSSKPGKKGE